MNLEKITNEVCTLADRVALFLHDEQKKLSSRDIRVKGVHNYVTYVDETAEQILIEGLLKILPGSGFIAEESPGMVVKELTWVVDPLDGTTNYIHGLPVYCISIALMEGGETLAGMIYEASQKEYFYTWKGSGSFMNGTQVFVSDREKLNESLFATGFPYYDYSRLGNYMELFGYMMQHTRGIRRLGSAAADLAWVACGRFDGFYEYGLSPWDVAAGAILVANAGGKVSDFHGGNNYIFGKEIITTNPHIYPDFLRVIREHF
jgi:myo-inositol-1(or 4)-monophosphatase